VNCATELALGASWWKSQAAGGNRLLKLLERANIKLASLATCAFRVSARLMLKALVEPEGELGGDGRTGQSELRNRIPNEFQMRPVLRALGRFRGLGVIK
jgi:hypothetical protein